MADATDCCSLQEPAAVRVLSTPRPAVAGAVETWQAEDSSVVRRRRVPAYKFYAVNYGQGSQKLGEVYGALAHYLHKQCDDWQPGTAVDTCHLVLGEAQAAGVHWARLGISRIKPLVNFYRGFQTLCRKTMMAQSLRSYAMLTDTVEVLDRFLPKTFIFTKKSREHAEFMEEFQRRQQECLENTWILKPSGGAHGDDIVVMNKIEDIVQFLDDQQSDTGGTAWVVQKYLERPLLLPGCRKFDVRCMVLLAPNYDIYIYSEGIIRSCSVKFSLDDLTDRFAHLANHCLQVHHPDYGKHEALNLLSYAEFDRFLCDSGQLRPDGCPARLATHILPQIEAQVVYSLLAVKDQMQVPDSSNFHCFNLLGYDFMLDDKCDVHLLEVNSSPTTDPRLIPELVRKVVEVAVHPLCPPKHPEADGSHSSKCNTESDDTKGMFKLIHGVGMEDHVQAR